MSDAGGPWRIDRCVCTGLTFESLRAAAEREELDLDGLREAAGCCDGCGLCEPYIRRMLVSGQTVFTTLLGPDD